MVQHAPEARILEEAPTREHVGKAHGGFVVALFTAAPALMVASMIFSGLVMGAASGATGTLWLGVLGMFGLMFTVFAGSVFLAESEG